MPAMRPIGRVIRYALAIVLPLGGLVFCASQCTTGMGTSILEVEVKGTLVFTTSGRPVPDAWVTALETRAGESPTRDPLDEVKRTLESIAAYVAYETKGEPRPTVEEFERRCPAGRSRGDGVFAFTHAVWRCEGTRLWPVFQPARTPMRDEIRSLWIQLDPNAPPVVIDIRGARWIPGADGWEGSLDVGVVRVPDPR